MDATILICTYNRASLLGPTLDSLAHLRAPELSWEVLVVDNNSTDETRRLVEARQADYPVPLHYLFEPRQGKSIALNTGLAHASGAVIAFTDDDVQVPEGWLEAAVRPLLTRPGLAYTGGPVEPLWEASPPRWLAPAGNLGGTIAVKDHGAEPFIFEERRKTPLGVNMAVRRSLIEQIGGFRPDLGRRGKSLLGQEQAEFFYRSRAAGALGLYVPEMTLQHHVPAARLTRSYFQRWWYWKGVSQARLHRIHHETELGLDLTRVPRIAGVPRYMLRSLVTEGLAALWAALRGHRATSMEHAMMVFYAVGYSGEQVRRWFGLGPKPEPAAVDITIRPVQARHST
ncbi:MAG: glycosyltransferase family 2 protein [Acidobacteria bacterium]|nr:glycosyltransferase family 2 protein [Acidobacteriota bacterium]